MRVDGNFAFPENFSESLEQSSDGPHVAILMCTKNGGRFLNEQLDSLQRQSFPQWTLYVSDDGSRDETLEILRARQREWGVRRLTLLSGPERGFVANFLSLACNQDIQADYFAWCDQDDVWKDEKLEIATTWLRGIPPETPALYCGRSETISEDGAHIGHSPLFERPPNFANALVQSIAGGNTMVFNNAARLLLQDAGKEADAPSHDWWTYQLVSGAGGVVRYDPRASILYRQHPNNTVGGSTGWGARVKRMGMVFRGSYRRWSERNIDALESLRHRLAEPQRTTLDEFKKARSGALLSRVRHYRRSGVFRQTFLGQLGLVVAIILKKV